MAALDSKFEELVAGALIDQASGVAAGMANRGQRPALTLGLAGALTDMDAVKAHFDTPEAWAGYHEAIAGATATGNTLVAKMTSKLQSDAVSVMERDFKAGALTYVRARTFEASRRLRHASRGGPLRNCMLHHVQALSSLGVSA